VTNVQGSSGKWVRVKGNGGGFAVGFKEVSVNAAGTVFLIDINNDIYYNKDLGFSVTKAALGKVEGTPANADPEKMTRRRAKKAGKLNIDKARKGYRKGRRNPDQKKKHRVIRKSITKKVQRKIPKNKKAIVIRRKKAVEASMAKSAADASPRPLIGPAN
jgi:hypothetical protein